MDELKNTHGATVRGAMTPLERRLTLGVLMINLGLGAWFLRHSDFSGVLPNGSTTMEAADTDALQQGELPLGPLLASNSGRP